jgi:hypothetical protein
MTGYDTPPVVRAPPYPRASERAFERLTLPTASHVHADAYDGDGAVLLDALVTGLQPADAYPPLAVGVEVVGLAVHRSIRAGKHERVIEQPVEGSDVARELRGAQCSLGCAKHPVDVLDHRLP